jgi:DNA-binding transcriptional regulator LsrR (DeoR family)
MPIFESEFDFPADESDAQLVFDAASLFFQKPGPGGKRATAAEICSVLARRHPGVKLTRESIYPLIARAVEYGMVRFVPPVHEAAARKLRERFPRAKNVVVVQNDGIDGANAIGAAAAQVALRLLGELGRAGYATVGLGLGPGKSGLDFSRSLSRGLEAAPGLPRLELFGITAGCIPSKPEFAPVSFFNLFPDHRVVRRVAMWAETLVEARDLKRVRASTGVKEAFAAKGNIQLIVTGLGDSEDEHDMLRSFFDAAGSSVKRPAMVGNVQYRPFGAKGPIIERDKEQRAVTLFELDELVRFSSQKDRYVILIARQCGLCGKDRSRALQYLLTRPDLAVFTHLVTDLATADALLAAPRGDAA